MMLLMMAMQMAVTQPTVKPVQPVIQPRMIVPVETATRKRQMIGDAQALIAQARRTSENYAPKPGQPSKAELDAAINDMKSDLDSMSEMGEMESLRLQMAMDRMSKLMSTLSNIMKKISDTSGSITNNIK